MSQAPSATSLDPQDWEALRVQGHRMLDDMLDNLRDLRDRPVWQAPTVEARARYRAELPRGPGDLAELHAQFMADIAPYGMGSRGARGGTAGSSVLLLAGGTLQRKACAIAAALLGLNSGDDLRLWTAACSG